MDNKIRDSILKGISKVVQIGIVLIFASAVAVGQDRMASLEGHSMVYNGKPISQDATKSAVLSRIISINAEDVPLLEVVEEIAVKAHLEMVYNSKLLAKKNRHITIGFEHVTVEKALWAALEGTGLQFTISADKQLVLLERAKGNRLPQWTLAPQKDVNLPPLAMAIAQETITGTVTDGQTGETLPGVNILVEGTSTGTSTDSEGNFELTVESLQDTLVVSFIGYQTQNIPIQGRTEIDIEMQSQVFTGEEMVVVGYGSIEEEDLTGSVASIDSRSLEEASVTNVQQAMMGNIPGVQVKPHDGTPGEPPTIQIRGVSSMSAETEPLYVVDGFPISDLSGIDPDNIAKIDVLKDASSTAIYGSRGSNGVVIITTKSGQIGPTEYNFNASYGLQKISNQPEYMTAEEQAYAAYWGAYHTTKDAGGSTEGDPRSWDTPVPQLALDYIEGKETPTDPEIWGTDMPQADWIDLVTRVAPVQNYKLSSSGGSEDFQFLVSGGYMNQDGIILGSDFKRFSMQGNFDVQLSEKLSLEAHFNPSYTLSSGTDPSGTGYGTGAISNATVIPEFIPPFGPDGDYFVLNGYLESGDYPNALALAKEVSDDQKTGRLRGNITTQYTIFDELEFNIMLGGRLSSDRRNFFQPKLPAFFNANPTGQEWTSFGYRWINEYTLNYSENFGEHQIVGLAGFSVEESKLESNYLSSNSFPNNLVPYFSATDGIVNDATSTLSEWSLVSYLSRINYNYEDIYYLTLTGRIDGSSRFGSDNRYGYFPSVALAWRISNENFLQDFNFLSNLKLRASYGQTGNNNIGNYAALATINNVLYPMGGSPTAGFVEERIPNPQLTWEKQNSVNVGLDAGFFGGRLNLIVDYFDTTSEDLLLNVNIPSITGFDNALQNIGKVQNKGWEAQVSSINITGERFEWTTDFNITKSTNKVLELGPEDDPIISDHHRTEVGKPMGMFYGLIKDGIFETSEELAEGPIYNPGAANETHVGDIKFKDFSGPNGEPDGIINSYDRVFMGSPHPDFYFGMTNRFSYQNLSLSISFQGVVGNEIYSNVRVGNLRSSWRRKLLAEVNNFWISEERPGDGQTPRPHDEPTGGIREPSSYFVEDGSYLRVNNITLSYTLPNNIAQKFNLNSARIYANTTNPFLISSTSGFNPDVTNPGNPLQPGEDNNQYPLAKTLNLGLNIGF